MTKKEAKKCLIYYRKNSKIYSFSKLRYQILTDFYQKCLEKNIDPDSVLHPSDISKGKLFKS